MHEVPHIDILLCKSCGHLDPGPRDICASCFSRSFETTRARGLGTLRSYTVVRRPPASHGEEQAYAVASIRLDAGVCITARLKDFSVLLSPGTRMRLASQSQNYVTFQEDTPCLT